MSDYFSSSPVLPSLLEERDCSAGGLALDIRLSILLYSPVAEFTVPLLGDKVDCGIGLLYRPASLCTDGPVQQSYAKVNFMYRRPTLYPLEIAVDFLKSP